MPDVPVPDDAAGLRAANAGLRAVVEAKDAQVAALRADLDAARERELRLAELERRLSMDSSDSGTPSSKERIGAKEARRARQQLERERRKDRNGGGQPGHAGKGPARDPDPDEEKTAEPPAECRRCRAGLEGAEAADPRWAQVIDAVLGLECSRLARNNALFRYRNKADCSAYGFMPRRAAPPLAGAASAAVGSA